MARAFEHRELNGFVFGARCIYRGESIVRYELLNVKGQPWPKDEELLKYFGERGFGGKVKHAGNHAMVEIYVD